MNTYICLALYAIIFIISFFVIKKLMKRTPRKWSIFIAWIVSAILFFCIYYPIAGHSAVSFSAAEDAFYASHHGEIAGIVEGNSSCFIVFTNERGAFDSVALARSENRYMSSANWSLKEVSQAFINEGSARIFRYADTNDFYILGYTREADKGTALIQDNAGSDFQQKKQVRNTSDSFETVVFWASIPKINKDYEISVNGIKTVFRIE